MKAEWTVDTKQNLRDRILEYGRIERVVGRETERYGEANYENVNASLEILEEITRDLLRVSCILGGCQHE